MTDRIPTLREREASEPADKVLRDGMQNSLNRAPMALNGCCCETAHEIAEPVKRSRVLVRTVVGALVIIGTIAIVRGVWGAEPPRTWQVWNETANKPWLSKKGEPATATGPTACNLSLWEVAKATQDGTRLSCRRIDEARQ